MAVVVSDFSRVSRHRIMCETELYPTNSGYGKETKSVRAYAEEDDCMLVPLVYAWRVLGINNDDISYERIDASQKLGPRNEYQRRVINAAITELDERRTCLIKAGPGSGKTCMATMITLAIRGRTLVLVDSTTLMGQWKEQYEKFTTCSVQIIGEELFFEADVTICLITRCRHIGKTFARTIKLLVVDECPLLCNQTGMNAMLYSTPKYVCCLSATPSRSRDGMFSLMELFVGERVVYIPQPISLDVYRVITSFTPREGGYKISWTKMMQSLMYNNDRNRLLVDLVLEKVREGHKVMMLTSETKHVETLALLVAKTGVTYDTFYGNKRTYTNGKILIANIKKASVGFDEAGPACQGFDGIRISCVVMCVSVASPECVIQSSGRSFRSTSLKPCVIYINDNDRIIDRHCNSAMGVYDTEEYVPTRYILDKR